MRALRQLKFPIEKSISDHKNVSKDHRDETTAVGHEVGLCKRGKWVERFGVTKNSIISL